MNDEARRDQDPIQPEDSAQERGENQAGVPREELTERGLASADETEAAMAEGIEQSDLNPPPETPTEAEYTGETDRERVEEAAKAAEQVDVENIATEEPSPAERVAANARTQASAAAEALRRGEMMRDVSVDGEADSDDRLIALLCYATQILIPLILPVLVLLSESSKNRPFQRFHAIQSLALVSILTVGAVVATTATAILAFVPIIGWLIGLLVLCISPIALLMAYFALVYYGYQAYQGKRFAIPGLTRFLQDQNWI